MVRIRIAKRRVEAYLMRYIIFYLLKKSNSFLEFFSFYFYITILMLYCQTNIDKMHKLLYIKNKKEATSYEKIYIRFYNRRYNLCDRDRFRGRICRNG